MRAAIGFLAVGAGAGALGVVTRLPTQSKTGVTFFIMYATEKYIKGQVLIDAPTVTEA